jgi:DNA-binding response OmpR family regulator
MRDMQQCSILFVNGRKNPVRHTAALRSTGFVVSEVDDLPGSADLVRHHVVIVRPPATCALPIVAARLRAAPRFGRRILIALVGAEGNENLRRDGIVSGFDDVLPQSISGQQLAAAIIRKLREIPELRCLLQPLTKRRAA